MNKKGTEKELRYMLGNIDLEIEIISRIVNEPKLMKEVYGYLEPEDFFTDMTCSSIYRQMSEDFKNGIDWSLLTLKDRLKGKDVLIMVSDYLDPQTFGPGQFKGLVERLKDKSLKRQIVDHATQLSKDVGKFEEMTPTQIVTEELDFFSHVRSGREKENSLSTLLDSHKNSGATKRLPSGIRRLDLELSGGFQRQDFIVIGARPSVGKTALSLTLAYSAAKLGAKVLFISVEMTGHDIIDRLLAYETNSSCTDVIRRNTPPELLEKGYEGLRKLPLSIYELYNATSNEAFAVASREKYKNGLDIVIIDYIQVLRDVPGDERVNVNQISRNLKMMARLLDVTVIAPSQVTRKSETQTGTSKGVPELHHLRESGNIESDADIVFLLHRDILGGHADEVSLRIAKNRKGGTTNVPLRFNQLTTKFEE